MHSRHHQPGVPQQRARAHQLGYRTMAGLSPVTEDTTDSAAAQMAALLFIANDSFDFSRSSKCYSQTGDDASQSGTRWLGLAGIKAIDGSMESAGSRTNRLNLLSRWLAEGRHRPRQGPRQPIPGGPHAPRRPQQRVERPLSRRARGARLRRLALPPGT